MTRKDLARAISEKTGLSRKDAEAAVSVVFATIEESLLRGEAVTIRGFGTFGLKYQRARKGRIIHSGQIVPIPPRLRASFEPSPQLQKSIFQKKELLERYTSE
ncbi:MAG: HU family DNA-binding protein [Bacteroidia bacterium]|nr:HU family DNA-binding protein [Bacteroidia bacterium]MCX7652253.1 HU family DNA-binding protein [Bacteroidia bacterium]MDW8416515.1 HU family DNA-binding protein [Bacteroidia bacterium]